MVCWSSMMGSLLSRSQCVPARYCALSRACRLLCFQVPASLNSLISSDNASPLLFELIGKVLLDERE